MKVLKQATYIRYVLAKLSKLSKQHADLRRFLFTEDSLKIKKHFFLFQKHFLLPIQKKLAKM